MTKLKEGSYYHLYNRGNNKLPLFFEDKNYYYFLAQLKKYLHGPSFIYSYCLMPNHFHVFLKIEDVASFEKQIRSFFISYTKSVNESYNRTGSLFEGRYKSSEIVSDSYFTRIITYIHQNPLKAGLTKAIELYKFSSYPAFLSSRPTLLCRDEVLEWFGGVEAFIEAHKLESKLDLRSF
jgi:REP element-mobilizing transposase RayT